MRRRTHEVKLDEDDVEWFQSTYPGGSLSWLFTTMLKEFRVLHKQTPADLAKIGAAEMKKLIEEGA